MHLVSCNEKQAKKAEKRKSLTNQLFSLFHCVRLLEQEQERLRKELRKQASETQGAQAEEGDGESARIKLKWKAAKEDPDNGGYTTDYLNRIFSCYGRISTLLVSAKRKGSAIIEYESTGVSSDILEETGHKDNPLSLIWLSGKLSKNSSSSSDAQSDASLFGSRDSSFINSGTCSVGKPGKISFCGLGLGMASSQGNVPNSKGNNEHKDFESLVLMRMRQAEERKRLTEQMVKEDEEG